MKRLLRPIAAGIVAVSVSLGLCAAKGDDYREFAARVRNDVYSMELPAFEVREAPDKYKDESMVYIAAYHEYKVRRNTERSRLPGTLMSYSDDKRVQGGELLRLLVKLNDKAALETFSEFDFSAKVTQKATFSRRDIQQVIGVRVIKPDGTVNDVDMEEFVDVWEGKKKDQRRQKLAVPGLEVGDIVDLFVYVSQDVNNSHPKPVTFELRQSAPVVDMAIHAEVDGMLCTQYRSLNTDSVFTGYRDFDGNFILDMHLADIPAKPRMAYSDIDQSPMIKFYVYNRSVEGFTPLSARVVGLVPEPAPVAVKDDIWSMRSWFKYKGCATEFLRDKLKNGGKAVSRLKSAYKAGEMSLQEVGDCAYNLLAYAYNSTDTPLFPLFFDVQLEDLLTGVVGDSLITVMSTPDDCEPLDRLSSIYDGETGTVLLDRSRYYFAPRAILSPSEIQPAFMGRKTQQFFMDKYRLANPGVDTIYLNLPDSKPSRNRQLDMISASIDGADVEVSRRSTFTGACKLYPQSLLTDETVNAAYESYLHDYGLEVAGKLRGKKAADRKGRYASDSISQIDRFKDEVEDYNSHVSTEFIGGNLESVGLDPRSPKLSYEVQYKIHDLVKQAGKNILLSIGQLMPGQSDLLESDKNRDDDAVLGAPHENLVRIELKLPDGYHVSDRSLEAIGQMVVNGVGAFSAAASFADGVLTIDAMERFNRRRVGAGDWADVVEVLDAAAAWQRQTILLEK